MTESRRFYWIKLKTNFFSREDIDFLLSQKNGSEYVVLYQMLCLNTANNNGRLESKIGEMLVPYNAEKIVRDCKYFDIDTVNIAMALYRKLGLIYEEQDGVLTISNYETMVGSETAWAEKKRLYRNNQKLLKSEDKKKDKKKDIVRQEYRDKSLEYRVVDNIYNISSTTSMTREQFLDEIQHLFNRILNGEEQRFFTELEINDVTLYAISEAGKQNKLNIKYIEKIIKDCKEKGITTKEQIEQREIEFEKSKNNKHQNNRQEVSYEQV